ncbi:MAG: YfhO family protein [Chloroflexota bacterium]
MAPTTPTPSSHSSPASRSLRAGKSSIWHRSWVRDLIFLALLSAIVGAFFWPLFLSRAWIPRGGGDLVSFLWPAYHFTARTLRSGALPLWNPHLHSGTPFIADNQSGLFYPVNLVAFTLFGPPSYRTMQALVIFHVWLAAAATFALLRELQLRRIAALTGAVAFAFSDLFVTHLGNLNLNATAAWLPLILWLTHRALARERVAWAAAAGATLAVAALAGHAQMLLFVGLALALYVVYHLVTVVRGRRSVGVPALRTVGLALLILAVGVGGAALMLLPAYQMAGHTGRGHLDYAEATRYSLPPRALIGLLAPGFYGRGPAGFWGSWDRVEVGYAGVGTLILAAFALVGRASTSPGRRSGSQTYDQHTEDRRSPSRAFPTTFFALLIPVAFALAMGRHTPLYRVFYRWVPTFDQIRAPARIVVLANLGLAALAACGLHRLLQRRPQDNAAAWWLGAGSCFAALLFVALGLPLARSLPPPDRVSQATWAVIVAASLLALNGLLILLARRWAWAASLFSLLLVVELIALGSTVEIERSDPTRGFHHPQVVAFLEQDPSLFRIHAAARAWQPDAALMHGLYDVGGVYNPLTLAPYEAYRWAVGQPGETLYNLLGVKYVLVDKGDPPPGAPLVPVHSAASEVDVYLNTAALPRALFVSSAHLVTDHGAAWEAIHDPAFDPAHTVVLERNQMEDAPPGRHTPTAQDPPHQGAAAEVMFTRYDLNALQLTVAAPAAGWLFLSDVYYPGWRATVDGEPTPVLRANYTFRAVALQPGEHTVEMSFTAPIWRVGLAISAATWLALAAATAVKLRGCTRPTTG